MNWDKYKTSKWLLNIGMNHIRDGLFAEGGELVYESKFGDAPNSKEEFISAIKRICNWDDEDISDAINHIEILNHED